MRLTKIKRMATLQFLLLLFANNVLAANICLYARSTNEIASGHSFVVIEDKNKVIVSYGFWPDSKHPGSIAVNKFADLPMATLKQMKAIMSEKMLRMTENHICQPFNKNNLDELREKVESYINEYGTYKTLANNCTHFAIRIYNFASGENFPVVQTPLRARKIMSQTEN